MRGTAVDVAEYGHSHRQCPAPACHHALEVLCSPLHLCLGMPCFPPAMGSGMGTTACPWVGMHALVLHSHRHSHAVSDTGHSLAWAQQLGEARRGTRKATGYLPTPHCSQLRRDLNHLLTELWAGRVQGVLSALTFHSRALPLLCWRGALQRTI